MVAPYAEGYCQFSGGVQGVYNLRYECSKYNPKKFFETSSTDIAASKRSLLDKVGPLEDYKGKKSIC